MSLVAVLAMQEQILVRSEQEQILVLISGSVSSSGGGGITAISQASDVAFSSLAANDLMKYDGTDWVNITPAQLVTLLNLAGLYQPLDADLTAIAALTTTAFGRGILAEANAASLISTLGLAGLYQPLDSDLTAIAALTTTAYGRAFLALADEAAFKAYVNLEIGTDVQAYDSDLAAIAALTTTSFGRGLLTETNAASLITTLGLAALYQPLDSDLTSIAALTTTAFGRGFLVETNAASVITTLGLAALYQPLDSDLTAIAALTTSSFGRSVLEAANAAAGATLFGVGTGNSPEFTAINLGHPSDTTITKTASGRIAVEGAAVRLAGKETIYIPAGAIRPSATGGCAAVTTVATTANQPDLNYLAFDTTTQEYAQFSVAFPKSWDEGTVTAQFFWAHGATVTNFGVVWNLQGVAESNDDPIAAAYGTAQQIADTGGTTNDLYVTSETPAITLAGTPAEGDLTQFRISRVTGDGSDTLGVDAWLLGIKLHFTTNAAEDT